MSYATIYRALRKGLMEAKGTRKNRHGRYPMEKHLRRKGWRGSRKGRKDRHFVHQTIEERPEEANNRSEIGHWEGDLVYSSFHKLYVVTLVDRKSRFLLTGISHSRKAEEVSDVICRLLKKLPKKHVRSLRVNPKFCVNSISGANRAKFICGGSRLVRLPPCQQHNAGGGGCQGRRSRSFYP